MQRVKDLKEQDSQKQALDLEFEESLMKLKEEYHKIC